MSDRLQKRLEEIDAPADVRSLAAELAEQALRDPLTGLTNRRLFDETLAQNIETARRYNRPLSLVLFDLDDLKTLNDTAGHEAGDSALKTFAQCLRENARKADIACRIGGDEFALILPETELSNVWKITDRIFQCLEKTGLEFPTLGKKGGKISNPWKLSATAGAAALPSENLFADADAALLKAKREKHA